MFKTPKSKDILPKLIVRQKNVYFIQKSRFLSILIILHRADDVPPPY